MIFAEVLHLMIDHWNTFHYLKTKIKGLTEIETFQLIHLRYKTHFDRKTDKIKSEEYWTATVHTVWVFLYSIRMFGNKLFFKNTLQAGKFNYFNQFYSMEIKKSHFHLNSCYTFISYWIKILLGGVEIIYKKK